MKKTALVLSLLFSTSASAHIRYDYRYHNVYSYPQNKSIGQDQYRAIFWQLVKRVAEHIGDKSSSFIADDIRDYLQTLNTPTSIRLLKDLKSAHPYHLFYAAFGTLKGLNQSDAKKLDNQLVKFFTEKESDLNKEEIEQYVDIVQQLGQLVVKCWNDGVEGVKVHDQMISLLTRKNNKVASYILSKYFQNTTYTPIQMTVKNRQPKSSNLTYN